MEGTLHTQGVRKQGFPATFEPKPGVRETFMGQ